MPGGLNDNSEDLAAQESEKSVQPHFVCFRGCLRYFLNHFYFNAKIDPRNPLNSTKYTAFNLKLTHHLGRIPVSVQPLYFAVFVDFKHVNAFEKHFLARFTCAAAGPFYRCSITRDKNVILG